MSENGTTHGDQDPAVRAADVQALRCADCARSDSLVTDLAPTSALPIPVEAMMGFPDGVPHAQRTPRGLDQIGRAHV